jgi:hypothetical protein
MTLNIPLAEKVLQRITSEPVRHDQDVWRRPTGDVPAGVPVADCDTAMCIAGWAGELAGGKWSSSIPYLIPGLLFDSFEPEPDDPQEHVSTFTSDPLDGGDGETVRYVRPGARGQRVLGLTVREADFLFAETSDEEAVETLMRWIAEAKRGDELTLPGWAYDDEGDEPDEELVPA